MNTTARSDRKKLCPYPHVYRQYLAKIDPENVWSNWDKKFIMSVQGNKKKPITEGQAVQIGRIVREQLGRTALLQMFRELDAAAIQPQAQEGHYVPRQYKQLDDRLDWLIKETK